MGVDMPVSQSTLSKLFTSISFSNLYETLAKFWSVTNERSQITKYFFPLQWLFLFKKSTSMRIIVAHLPI